MPIKNTITGTIPFLQSYVPYSLASTETETDLINDMVSVDISPPATPVILEYGVGTPNSYVTSLYVKNLTSNATLKVGIVYDKTIFNISTTEYTISPDSTIEFVIRSNNQLLNARLISNSITTISLNITNLTSGVIITKSVSATKLAERKFPENIVL
jgi:hypothetical protein